MSWLVTGPEVIAHWPSRFPLLGPDYATGAFLVHVTGIVWMWFLPLAVTIPALMLYWDELPFNSWILVINERKR